jgi:hypothetical protein
MNKQGLEAIALIAEQSQNNRLRNYILAGLDSYLVGDQASGGKVRMFESSRATRDEITPHSHRFDFACLVLSGRVVNTLYEEPYGPEADKEQWGVSTIDQVCGPDGVREYVHTHEPDPIWLVRRAGHYGPGDIYWMSRDEIHSITFSAGTRVVFFEGPQVVARSRMIEPWVNGKVVPTFHVEPWMFEKVAP